MFNNLPEQPQGVADVIGWALRFWRRHLAVIVRFLLVPSIFVTLVGITFQWIMNYGMLTITHSKNIGEILSFAGLLLLDMVAFIIAWWFLILRILALVRLMLGFSATLDQSFSYINSRCWSIAGVYLLVWFGTFAMTIFWMLEMASGLLVGGGVIRGVATFITMTIGIWGIFFTVCLSVLSYNLALCVIACENGSTIHTLTRSFRLLFKHTGRSLGFGIVFLIAFFIISYPLSLPIIIATFIDYIQHGVTSSAARPAYSPPLYLLIFSQIWESIIGMLLRPLVLLAFGLFYYDLRMRSEGLDIMRKLETIESNAAPVADLWN